MCCRKNGSATFLGLNGAYIRQQIIIRKGELRTYTFRFSVKILISFRYRISL